MNDMKKRFLLFIFGCIFVRALFVYFAKKYVTYLPMMGSLAIIPMIGFFYIFFTDSRKTGGEVFGDKIWWNYLRPIHGTLYGIFAHMAIKNDPNAWVVLLLDVIIGLSSFLIFHGGNGNLQLMMQ
jgi:hypothetical protein